MTAPDILALRLLGKSLEWWIRRTMLAASILLTCGIVTTCNGWLFPPEQPQKVFTEN